LIETGSPAPDFTLPNHRGEDVSLSDLRGQRVLLIFYPQDFSPGCSNQLTLYQEVLPEIEAKGVKPLGISVDSTWAHRAFRKELGTDIELLADFNPKGEVTRSYGAFIDPVDHGNRSLVLIDPEGVVEWVHEAENPGVIPGANLIFDALDGSSE
jgi:peroxiredoxin